MRRVPKWVRTMKPGVLRSYLILVFLPMGREARRNFNIL